MSVTVKRYVADARTPHELWVMYLHEVRVTTKTSRADPQSTKAECDLGLLLYSTNVRGQLYGRVRPFLPSNLAISPLFLLLQSSKQHARAQTLRELVTSISTSSWSVSSRVSPR